MAKTGRPNFAYVMQGSWRGTTHNFQITGNTTGSALNAADAQTFMEGTSSPYAKSFAPFQAVGDVNVIGSRYYNGTSSAPVYEADYTAGSAPAPLTPTSAAFTAPDDLAGALEVCVMLDARVGTSSKGKPIFCRKYLRGVPTGVYLSDNAAFDFTAAAATAAHAMGNGSWFNSITYCSPSGATADVGGWTAQVWPWAHQVPRGRKRKVVAASKSSSLLSDLLTAIAGGASATALEKIIAAAG